MLWSYFATVLGSAGAVSPGWHPFATEEVFSLALFLKPHPLLHPPTTIPHPSSSMLPLFTRLRPRGLLVAMEGGGGRERADHERATLNSVNGPAHPAALLPQVSGLEARAGAPLQVNMGPRSMASGMV